jgi:hypothetical protein
MKVVINRCYGGFSLSARAVARIAELQGRKCYFFKHEYKPVDRYIPVDLKDLENKKGVIGASFFAFDIPNPNEELAYPKGKTFYDLTDKQRVAHNAKHETHSLSNRPDDRADPLLIKVVEELKEKANGACAELSIVEIPDGTDYEIDEYDGMERVHERHRSWA